MRIPTSKLYRAFKELDHLTDEQCGRLIQRIRTQKFNTLKTGCVSILAVVVSIVVVSLVFALFMELAQTWVEGSRTLQTILPMVVLVGIIGFPAFAGLMTRDAFLRRNLSIALHDYIERVRCLKCQYILIGLPAESGCVTCAECGHAMTLESLGATEQDLLPPTEGETSAKRFELS